MSRFVVAIAMTVMAMPAHALTPKKLQEMANGLGRRIEVGYVPMTPQTVVGAKPATIQPVTVYEPARRSSPSLIDLSATPPDYVPPPYVRDPGAYSAKLEARSLKIFGYNREEERQRWMADQEQREIANRINASKPLFVPVNSR